MYLKWGDKKSAPKRKERRNPPERVLNEIKASKLSDIEFKIMVIRKLNELSESYKNYREAIRNLLGTTSA